jgi:hypothetical protein
MSTLRVASAISTFTSASPWVLHLALGLSNTVPEAVQVRRLACPLGL